MLMLTFLIQRRYQLVQYTLLLAQLFLLKTVNLKTDMLTCNTSIQIQELSDFCISHPDANEVCYPESFKAISIPSGVWCIVNAIVGFAGNLLTLVAIPYASSKQK